MGDYIKTPAETETRLWVVARYLAARGWVRFRDLNNHPDTRWRDPQHWDRIYTVADAFRVQRLRELGL